MGWLEKTVGAVVTGGTMAVLMVMNLGQAEVSALDLPVCYFGVAAGEGGAIEGNARPMEETPVTKEPGGEGSSEGSDADEDGIKKVETNILPGDMDIEGLLRIIVSILGYGLGVAAVLGIVIAGLQYLTARDSEAQVAEAKKRLYNVVIGLIAWAVMFVVLNWLIPGGLNLG